jgi:sugar phosphate isomerase/epimerase
MPFRYSVISETIGRIGHYVLETPEPILEAIKRAGFDAVDLPGNPQKLDVDKFRRLLDSTGLEVNEILGAWAYHHAGENRDMAGDDVEARRRGIDYGKACIDLASALGAKYYQICASQTPVPQIPFPKLPLHVLRSNFLESTREICEYGGERDITVLFEPLNRYEAYSGIMTSVFDAISLIDDLGLPNLGVQPDVYHMNISEASTTSALMAAGDRIKVMHMNETNHCFLGEGHADYPAILGVLKEIGFDGFLSIYMGLVPPEISYRAGVSEEAARPGLQEALERQLSFLKMVESSVDYQRRLYGSGAGYVTREGAADLGESGTKY